MRIIGIDPGLRRTGYGVVETVNASTFKPVAFGVIISPSADLPSACLQRIHDELVGVLRTTAPTEAAVEGVIYLQNYQTAITLGAARGVAVLAMAAAGLPVYEYAPRRIKSATTGRGGAQKAQVSFMMRALLGLTENPPADAADALAVAMTHAQSRRGVLAARRL